MLLKAFLPQPWQAVPWGIALIAQCWLIPARLNDAGRRPWLPLMILAAVAGVVWLLGQWAVRQDQGDGGDGIGLLYAMASIVLIFISAAILIVWPGLLPSRPST